MNRQQQHSLVMIASRTFQTVSRLYCWATVRHVKWPFTELRQYCTIILYTLYTIQLKRGKILQFHECKVYSFCLFVRSREQSEIVEQMKKIKKKQWPEKTDFDWMSSNLNKLFQKFDFKSGWDLFSRLLQYVLVTSWFSDLM